VTRRLANFPPAKTTTTSTKTNDGTARLDPLPARPSHNQILDHNIGWRLDPEKWASRHAANEVLADQSAQMAAALGRQGIELRLKSEVFAISAITGQVEKLTAYRACRFVPSVAARDRHPMLSAFKFFNYEHSESQYFRYVVVTRGEMIPAGGALRSAIQAFHRRLSKFAHWSRQQDVELLFRGSEFTRQTALDRGMADRYPPDTLLYNLHANLVTWPTRRLKRLEWQHYLQQTWDRLGTHWRDNGRIETENELIKYICKPAELIGASDAELAWLFRDTAKLKFAQPLGAFADFLAELKKNRQKVVYVRPGGGPHPVLMKIEKGRRLNHTKRQDADLAEHAVPETREKPTNIILGFTLPSWKCSPWSEPQILILRYDPTAKGKGDRERLQEIELERRIFRDRWDAAGAPPPEEALRVAKQFSSGKTIVVQPSGGKRRRRSRL